MANNLLFERFLNPQRTGMPDIDVDFEQGRRPEVLRYIERRFGRDRVARIGTFGAALSRAALKDAARVLDLTPLAERLSKLVPIGAGTGKPVPFTTLDDTSDRAGEAFRTAVAGAGDDGDRVLRLARAFEGVTKAEGIHACGTLIADEPMAPLVPLRRDRAKGAGDDDLLVTVWDGKDVDAYGLLKMDVLGLRNLDVISAAVDFIHADTGELIDPDTLVPGCGDSRDQATWELISDGRTAGVFQLESAGMTRLAEAVAPGSLADLTALVALYRPGPMAAGMPEHYAARKNGREAVDYDYLTTDPAEQAAIASVLDVTYGTIVYQEQLMQLSQVVGGLEPADRNKLQKAFSKKDARKMAEVKTAMFDGALAGRGTSGVRFAEASLDRLWTAFEGSAAYLFNASHACAYGFVAYQTAYLKANWPTQYGAALLACTDGDEKRHAAIRSLQVEGVEILPPDINRSAVGTQPDGDAVRLGLSEVKGVGKNATHIVAERDKHGDFTGLGDVATRVKTPRDKGEWGALPVNTIEALVEAGAFDEFGPRLGLKMVARVARSHPAVAPLDAEWGVLERSARQRSRLGLIAGAHPLVAVKDQIAGFAVFGNKPRSVTALERCGDGERVMLLGVLSSWAQKSYRGGQMVTMTVEGSRGSVDGVMWDDDRRRIEHAPTVGDVVAVQAQVRVRLVETERIDEDGETVTDSFERRELTVKKVLVVPVDDPVHLAQPEAVPLVLPDTTTQQTVQPATKDRSAEASTDGQCEVEPDERPDEGPAEQDADSQVPDTGALDADVLELHPDRPVIDVVRLARGSLARTDPALASGVGVHDLPAGFHGADGGTWLLTTSPGKGLLVVVGNHDVPVDVAPAGELGWSQVRTERVAAA